jgi:hypothetical protein
MTDISQEAREAELQLIDYLLSLGARGDDNETAIANETLAGLFDDYRTEIECAAEQRGREHADDVLSRVIEHITDSEVELTVNASCDQPDADLGWVLEIVKDEVDSFAQAIRNAKENEHG